MTNTNRNRNRQQPMFRPTCLPKQRRPTGYVLFETDDIVCIVILESSNSKTGNMAQIYFLVRGMRPWAAVKAGKNHLVCFDCPLQGVHLDGVQSDDNGAERGCYVNLAQGPTVVMKEYAEGKYPYLPESRYAEIFSKLFVRFGAYGEPVLMPVPMMQAIASVCKGHTGYTHQWRKSEFQQYRAYVMASCNSESDYRDALAMGWRAFRVRSASDSLMANEIICPASDEAGKRTQCIKCRLCDGSKSENDARKNIAIIVHGSGSKNFVSLESIALAA